MSNSSTVDSLGAASGDLLVSINGAAGTVIQGLSYDDRKTEPGDLFFCVPGRIADGHRFAPSAIAAGATALCVERPLGLGVPEICVRDVRQALPWIAAEFLDHPARALKILGITGTNGKTTTAYLLESILAAEGVTTGLIGTIETRVAGVTRPGVRTTPESLDLQLLFAEMREAGVQGVAMEVTSHALALHRVDGIRFAAAAFTNLTQDHLDFHRDMEDYFAAKRSLFVPERAERGATNVDDPYGRKLYENSDIDCLGFGIAHDADVRAIDVRLEARSSNFTIVTPSERIPVETSLVGAFNVSNALAACATALQAGIDPSAIASGLNRPQAVPGRFESVDRGQPFTVVVDYAHTPNSLENVLSEARRLAASGSGRVICLFGCGGDRDRGKRPLMGAVAARLADVLVVTSDNPRSEDPRAILDEIIEGVLGQGRTPDTVLIDRAEAIAEAVGAAAAGDVVVIAGKGHETGQQFADVTVPFDDREVAREVLDASGWGPA